MKLDVDATIPDILIPASIARDSEYVAAIAAAVAALVASSPSTLDTLDELAAALGDDPNFATTITTLIGTKAPSTRSIGVGTGLSGGGDLSADRTISLGTILAALVSNGTPGATGLAVLLAADAAAARSTLGVGWAKLADTTLGSDAAALTASWSGTFSTLQIRIIGRTTNSVATASVSIQFNSDTTSIYYTTAGGSGTSFTAGVISGSATNTDRVGMISANISNVGSHKTYDATYLARASNAETASAGTAFGTYKSTSIINSIQLAVGGNNFAAGSRLIVLGMP